MSKSISIEFDAIIRKREDMDNYYIPLPFDAEQTFGKKRLKAKIWYDEVLYRGLVAKYDGAYNLMMNKKIREQVGKKAGQKIHVKIEEDTEERKVEMPEALTDLLKKEKALKKLYEGLSFTHRKEYADWIASAKKEETLQNRLIKFRDLLIAKQKL